MAVLEHDRARAIPAPIPSLARSAPPSHSSTIQSLIWTTCSGSSGASSG
jgi:hypothetical protein